MADVRALFREQRSAHHKHDPHAEHSPSGKLLCNICHELIKREASWDDHIRSANHRLQLRNSRSTGSAATRLYQEPPSHSENGMIPQYKRKYDELEAGNTSGTIHSDNKEGGLREKKSRSQNPGHMADIITSESSTDGYGHGGIKPIPNPKVQQPLLGRRMSGTPVQGIELQIPSRPATPNTTRDSFLTNNPSIVSSGLVSGTSTSNNSTTSRSVTVSKDHTDHTMSNMVEGAPKEKKPDRTSVSDAEIYSWEDLDEAEWAAFEADVVNAPNSAGIGHPSNVKSVVASTQGANLVKTEGPQSPKNPTADAQMNDEKEEADRALETEFEDMVELESRVKKLREKREALRRKLFSGASMNKEIYQVTTNPEQDGVKPKVELDGRAGEKGEDDDDDDDDDEEADDWNGFRFKV